MHELSDTDAKMYAKSVDRAVTHHLLGNRVVQESRPRSTKQTRTEMIDEGTIGGNCNSHVSKTVGRNDFRYSYGVIYNCLNLKLGRDAKK